MYKSKQVQEFISTPKSNTEESKEEKLAKVLSYVKQDLTPKKSIVLMLSITSIFILIFSLSLAFFKNEEVFNLKNIILTSIIYLSVLAIYLGLRQDSLKMRLDLFNLLSDNPYEVRMKWDGGLVSSIIKITVEANLVKAGGVIKEKSNHFTAYLDISSDSRDQVSFIQDLVLKAEESFEFKKALSNKK